MKHIAISDMTSGADIRQFFVLNKKEERVTKRGDPFWDVTLSDATGKIKGKVWSDSLNRCQADLEPGSVVGVAGSVQMYQEEPQLTVTYLADVETLKEQGRDVSGLDMSLLLASTSYDVDVMWRELLEMVDTHIGHEELKNLVKAILEEHEEAVKRTPAALLYHHSYRGGLLEHCYTLMKSVVAWYEWEQTGNLGLMIAGAALHDIGKIFEIEGTGVYEKTLEGRLCGHIIQGRDMVREAALKMEFSDAALLTQLEHIILSHHGQLEFGSPVPPKPEKLSLCTRWMI